MFYISPSLSNTLIMYVGFEIDERPDVDELNAHFMALDPERVGLETIEVPQVCDFGDNVLDYMTRGPGGHTTEPQVDHPDEQEEEEADINFGDDEDGDDDDNKSICSTISDVSTEELYGGVLPRKFVAFLQS
jgi:hypothetical protein